MEYRITHWHEYIKQNLFVGTFLKSPLSLSSDAFGILIGGDRVHASSSKHACGQVFADKSVYTMYNDIANEGMAGQQWKCFYFVCGVLSACLQWFKFSMLWLACDQLVKQSFRLVKIIGFRIILEASVDCIKYNQSNHHKVGYDITND